MKEQTEAMELDLYRLVTAVLRSAWRLILAGILGAGLVLAGTYFLAEPEYQASVMFYVNNTAPAGDSSPGGLSSGDLTTSRNLVDSFIVLLTTRDALMEVIRHSGTTRSHEELAKMISAAAVNDTEFFRITVTGPNPEEAQRIAEAIGILLPSRIADVIQGTTARLVEEAVVPKKPSGPDYWHNAMLGFGIGFLLALGWVVLRVYLDSAGRRYILTELCQEAQRNNGMPESGKYLRQS